MIRLALLPAFQKPEEASWLFLDEMALALCAHVVGRYGVSENPGAGVRGGLSIGNERRAKEFLVANVAESVSIADVATECGLSRGHFLRAFKTTTGTTPHKWLQAYRVEKAKSLLLDGSASADVALKCGFADQAHLSRVFSLLVGSSPGAWRRSQAKTPITHA
jgi:AraC family transcriptional regulator